jgi:Ca2+-binding EF-hand superfamily protein
MLGASLAAPVFAQQPPAGAPGPGPMPAFADFDLNKDGKITEEEFNEVRAARIADRAQKGYRMRGLQNAASFADIDTNRDGALSPAEFAAHQAMHRQQMMGR